MLRARASGSRASRTSSCSRATATRRSGDAGRSALVFADAGRPFDWEAILALLEPGGLLVKDDLTPGRPVDGDPVREFLLRDPRLAGVEILTTPATAAIVAVRR